MIRRDEQGFTEQGMPDVLGGDFYRQVMFRVGADVQVRDEALGVL